MENLSLIFLLEGTFTCHGIIPRKWIESSRITRYSSIYSAYTSILKNLQTDIRIVSRIFDKSRDKYDLRIIWWKNKKKRNHLEPFRTGFLNLSLIFLFEGTYLLSRELRDIPKSRHQTYKNCFQNFRIKKQDMIFVSLDGKIKKKKSFRTI